jgi:hypothetical protein
VERCREIVYQTDMKWAHPDHGAKPSVTAEPLDTGGWFELQYGRSTENIGWQILGVDFQDL